MKLLNQKRQYILDDVPAVWNFEVSLAELLVFSVGGSSGQGGGNAEASSSASLLRHGAL